MNRKISLFLIVVFLFFLPICLFSLSFTHSRIPLQDSKGNILKDYSDIVKDANGDGLEDIFIIFKNHIYIYLMRSDCTYQKSPSQIIDIPPNAKALDVGDIHPDKGDEIALIYPDGLYCFSFKGTKYGATPIKIIDERTVFVTQDVEDAHRRINPEPTVLSFVLDFDGDGLDDVILPKMELYAIYFQDKDRSFTSNAYIKTDREVLISYSSKEIFESMEAFFYSQRQYSKGAHFSDFNLDGKLDIVKYEFTDYSSLDMLDEDFDEKDDSSTEVFYDKVSVFLQSNDRRFPESSSFTVEIPRYPMERYDIVDINGDSYNDLCVRKLYGDVTNAKTRVKVILNDKKNQFSDDSAQIIRTKGMTNIFGSPPLIDINNDGALDLYLYYVNISVASVNSMIKAFFDKGIPAQIRFYLFDKEKNQYPKSPDFEQKVRIGYNVFDFSYEKPKISFDGDFNGDKMKDMIMQTESDKLSIYRFVDEKRGFKNTPFSTIKSQPIKNFFVVDLNKDGVSDIITTEKMTDSFSSPASALHIYISKN